MDIDTIEPEISPNERMLAIVAHISFYTGFGIIATILIWFCHDSVTNRKSAFVEHHAKQALVYQIFSLVFIFIMTIATFFTCGVSALLIPITFVFPILATLATNKNQLYTYPCQGFVN